MKAFGQQQTNQSFTIKLGGMATGFEPLKDKAKVGVISTTASGTSAMLLKSTFGQQFVSPKEPIDHSIGKTVHQMLQSKEIAAPSAFHKRNCSTKSFSHTKLTATFLQ